MTFSIISIRFLSPFRSPGAATRSHGNHAQDELSPVTPAITIVQPSGVGGGGSQGPSEQLGDQNCLNKFLGAEVLGDSKISIKKASY